jgi:hypothetical protein
MKKWCQLPLRLGALRGLYLLRGTTDKNGGHPWLPYACELRNGWVAQLADSASQELIAGEVPKLDSTSRKPA